MPAPCAGDDLAQVIVFRLPAKFAFYFFGGCNETCRIAGTPRQFVDWDGMSCDLAGSLDHFTDRVAVPAAQVVDQRIAFAKSIQREQVRGDQVRNMDVVTDAGSVRRWIVSPIDVCGL